MIPPGTYDIGPSEASLHLNTYREGMAKKVGHDLVLEAGKWQATATVDGDITKSTLTATVDPSSITVVSGTGGAKSLSDGDRKDIEKNLNDKVLKTSQFPEITFRSTKVQDNGGGKFSVTGDLTIMGKTNPATMDIAVTGNKAKATMNVVQTKWGIKPFSALMGALKVRDDVDITVEGNVPQA